MPRKAASPATKPENKPGPGKKLVSPKEALFPIVGIGTSAGGLEALEHFLGPIPDTCGMAFVVVQHLDPNRKDILPELLQRLTRLHVVPVADRTRVRPNTVYVIPPNKNMSLLNGVLHLFDPVEPRGLRLPVDFLFRSLADDCQENSIGIILSGMGSDGSLGVRTIKERGGIVLVQEPSTAKFDGMPRSALAAVQADIIGPAEQLAEKLMLFLHKTPLMRGSLEIDDRDKNSLEKVILLLRSATGNDFSQYKKTTIYRRVERRMTIHQISKLSTYVRYLQENPQEATILFRELLIGVTSFFRDTAVWETIQRDVIPSLIARNPHGIALRAWVPACATGEEAYSLAIVFREALEKAGPLSGFSLQIFATDLDLESIEEARKGCFKENITTDVTPGRLTRFFTKTDHGYRINSEIREMIVFAPQNVLMDPPFTKIDIISCRNLLIYLEPVLQKKILGLFSYCLNPGGILLLGNAETIGLPGRIFSPINTKFRLYKSIGNTSNTEMIDFPSTFSKGNLTIPNPEKPVNAPENLQASADQLILSRFCPPAVVTNENGEIVYVRGSTGKYLEPSTGRVNWNLFAMLREGLQREVRRGFSRALETEGPVTLINLKIGGSDESPHADVLIQRLDQPSALRGLLLLVFYDRPEPRVPFSDGKRRKKQEKPRTEKDLECELQQAREDLQKTIEEMHTSQEELKSTNEELQSTNEELQSTNEELTTSKEEMQSLNEELQTVNAELQNKVDEFSRVNNDMANLFNSTDIATLFLDRNLNIRRFTTQATRIFKMIASDVGRPFTDQVSILEEPNLPEEALEVMRSLVPLEKVVPTRTGGWYKMRIMPYRTVDDRIEGLAITFIDITDRKIAEQAFQDRENELKAVIRQMDRPFGLFEILQDHLEDGFSGKFLFINKAFETFMKLSAPLVEGRTLREVWPHLDPEWGKFFATVLETDEVKHFSRFFPPLEKIVHCSAYRPGSNPSRFCLIIEETDPRKTRKK